MEFPLLHCTTLFYSLYSISFKQNPVILLEVVHFRQGHQHHRAQHTPGQQEQDAVSETNKTANVQIGNWIIITPSPAHNNHTTTYNVAMTFILNNNKSSASNEANSW